jgi:hypothetical protein
VLDIYRLHTLVICEHYWIARLRYCTFVTSSTAAAAGPLPPFVPDRPLLLCESSGDSPKNIERMVKMSFRISTDRYRGLQYLSASDGNYSSRRHSCCSGETGSAPSAINFICLAHSAGDRLLIYPLLILCFYSQRIQIVNFGNSNSPCHQLTRDI